jgi:hypothetical protein
MHPPKQPYTPVVEIVAVVDEVADAEVDEEMDARSPNAHTEKLTIIPPKHAERESTVKTTQTPLVQTPAVQTPAVQTPPGTTNVLATAAVSQATSSRPASTSNVTGINATKSTKAQHRHLLLQQEIAT